MCLQPKEEFIHLHKITRRVLFMIESLRSREMAVRRHNMVSGQAHSQQVLKKRAARDGLWAQKQCREGWAKVVLHSCFVPGYLWASHTDLQVHI